MGIFNSSSCLNLSELVNTKITNHELTNSKLCNTHYIKPNSDKIDNLDLDIDSEYSSSLDESSTYCNEYDEYLNREAIFASY